MLINQKNKTMPNEHIVIEYRREFIEISFESIEYISTDDYITTFFYVNGNKFTCTKPLNKIIPKLNADFYQIQQPWSHLLIIAWMNKLPICSCNP